MTVSVKTSLVHTKFKFMFLGQLIAILNSYPHTMSPVVRLKWSAFGGVDLQPCKTMIDTMTPVERNNWVFINLESSYVVRTIRGQLVTSCLHLGRFFLLPLHPLLPPPHKNWCTPSRKGKLYPKQKQSLAVKSATPEKVQSQ